MSDGIPKNLNLKKSADKKSMQNYPVGKELTWCGDGIVCQSWIKQVHVVFKVIQKAPYQIQWHSQNAEKVTHIKGRLLDQAVVLFNCVLFQNGNFS